MEVYGKLPAEMLVCGPCRIDGSSISADGFCEECEEYMCSSCFRVHLKYSSKRHVLGSLSQGQTQAKVKDQGTQSCQKHFNYDLRYYCRKHDKVACGDCLVVEHTDCKMEFVNDVGKKFENTSEFTTVLEKIKGLESEYTDKKRKQEKNQKENVSMTENILAEIGRFRKELNVYLDNAEREIIMESNRLSKENDDLISDLETKMNQAKLQLDDLSATLDTSLYKGDILFIRFVECKRRVSDVEQSLAEIKKKNYIKTFTFIPEERLSDLMASKVKLGALSCATSKSDKTSSAKKEITIQSAGIATGGYVLKKSETEDRSALSTTAFNELDPRARGFDVCKRVRYLGSQWKGTVTSVDPAGYVVVRWDSGGQYRHYAGTGGEYDVVLE